MSTFNRYTYLATHGNYAFAEKGRQIFSATGGPLNLLAGEPFMVDKDGITLEAADIATADWVSIGVGLGEDGGIATDVRYLAGEHINLCRASLDVHVTPPQCSIPQVMDVLFGPVDCNKTYTLGVLLDDALVRSRYGQNEKAKYIFQAVADCSCEDCDPSYDCTNLACQFVDLINGTVQTDPTKVTWFQKADINNQYQPFRAARLFTETTAGGDPTRSWCLSLSDDACEECSYFGGITSIKITDDSLDLTAEETVFTNTTVPGDATKSLPAHLQSIINQINDALAPYGGSAHLVAGYGKCCAYCIEINSCLEEVTLTINGVDVSADTTESPLDYIQTLPDNCLNCGDAADTRTFPCGVRLYVDPIDLPCDCKYPPNLPSPMYYGRTIELQQFGEGWDCVPLHFREVTAQQLPEGFGYYYQDTAHYGQHNGGAGRDFRNSNRRVGNIGLPDDFSRATNAAAGIKCAEAYCIWDLHITSVGDRFFNNAHYNINTDSDTFLVPLGDYDTQTSWEAILAEMQSRGMCVATEIECATEPAQGEPVNFALVGDLDGDAGPEDVLYSALADVIADIECNEELPLTWEYVAASAVDCVVVNVPASNKFTVDPTCPATTWSFDVEIFCGTTSMGTATVSGTNTCV